MDAVQQAMEAIDRRGFLRAKHRARAKVDAPLPIGCEQTNSQPRTVAAMLRLLDLHPGQRILDVGSGSGWTTALLARLTGPDGEVIGVELEPSLAQWGAANLAAYGFTNAGIQTAQPGVLGWPDLAPYDRILVSASARRLPQALVQQLGFAGVMVLPVRTTMLRVRAVRGADPIVTEHGSYSFVPLR